MNAASGIATATREVYTLADRVVPPSYSSYGIDEGDIRRILEKLTARGCDVEDISQRFNRAVDNANLASTPPNPTTLDVLNMDTNEVTALIRHAAVAASNLTQLTQARHHFVDAAARQAANEIGPLFDQYVGIIGKDFAKHLKVIAKAHKAGITTGTTAEAEDVKADETGSFRRSV